MPIGGQQKPPPQVKPNPFTPAMPEPLLFEDFAGINTSTTRPGVPDEQMAWCDGFMPIAKRNLRTLPGVGTAIATVAGSGTTLVWYGFGNIGSTPYCISFLGNGQVTATDINTLLSTTILPVGTILNPSIVNTGLSQWGREYIIIVADQTNGYWLWNGSLVFTAGTLGPIISLTNVGSGYKTVPFVTASGGNGGGATFAASIANGIVTGVTVTDPGSGWKAGDTVVLTFSGGNSGGTGASLVVSPGNMSGGAGSGGVVTLNLTLNFPSGFTATSANIVSPGSGYSQFVTATVSGGDAFPANEATISLTTTGGAITGVTIISGGIYGGTSPAPTVTITDPGSFVVDSVGIISGGSGYSPSAQLVFAGGASAQVQASGTLTIVNGVITGVVVQNGGIYGGNSPTPAVAVSDPAVNAAGSIVLMPFGIQGTWVETYQGRVWVGKQATVYFSAPGAFNSFATSLGGGNFTSADSFLQRIYTRGKSTNGFLYLFGDSSINYISGVQTTGTPPTTTFTNQNADPEVGTPYPQAIVTVGQNILFANSFGIHLLTGAKVTKVSEALDGVWNSVANFGDIQLSAAKANIFSRKCWMVLARIVDPVSLATVNKLMMWDGGKKWWTSGQDITLAFVAPQELNSVFTAYGTDGTVISPLFQVGSTAFTKTVQSRLYDAPGGYMLDKAASRFWSMWRNYTSVAPNLVVKIDAVGIGAAGQFDNQNGYTITGPANAGYFITPPEAVGQYGVLTGMTMSTTAADVSLISSMLAEEVVGYRG